MSTTSVPFLLNYSVVTSVTKDAIKQPSSVNYNGKTYEIYEQKIKFKTPERFKKWLKVIFPTILSLGFVLLDPRFRFDWQIILKGWAKRKLAVNNCKWDEKDSLNQKINRSQHYLKSPSRQTLPHFEEIADSSDDEDEPKEEVSERVNLKVETAKRVLKVENHPEKILEPLATTPTTEKPAQNYPIKNWVIVGGPSFTEHGSREEFQAVKDLLQKNFSENVIDELPDSPVSASAGVLLLVKGSQRLNLNDKKALVTFEKLKAKTGKDPLVIIFSVNSKTTEEFRGIPSEKVIVAPTRKLHDTYSYPFPYEIEEETELVNKIKKYFG